MANEPKKIERNCETCRYSETRFAPPPSIERIHVCRRFPPTAIAVQGPQGIGQMSVFPLVTAEAWCHEWTPAADESKLNG